MSGAGYRVRCHVHLEGYCGESLALIRDDPVHAAAWGGGKIVVKPARGGTLTRGCETERYGAVRGYLGGLGMSVFREAGV